MKKTLLILLVVALVSSTLAATPIKYNYTPYEETEFPLWSRELRRAETIFFGSYVVTLPVAYGLTNVLQNTGMVDFHSSNSRAASSLLIGSGLSLFISALDWYLGRK